MTTQTNSERWDAIVDVAKRYTDHDCGQLLWMPVDLILWVEKEWSLVSRMFDNVMTALPCGYSDMFPDDEEGYEFEHGEETEHDDSDE